MRILLVEDDDYKSSDIARAIVKKLNNSEVIKAASVTSALRYVSSQSFDLLILDMSLPTFDLSGAGGGGSPQSQGGVEVLRLMKRRHLTAPVIVITQYPDIEFDGQEVPLARASKLLAERFQLPVLACLAYEFDRDTWRHDLSAVLERFSAEDGD